MENFKIDQELGRERRMVVCGGGEDRQILKARGQRIKPFLSNLNVSQNEAQKYL